MGRLNKMKFTYRIAFGLVVFILLCFYFLTTKKNENERMSHSLDLKNPATTTTTTSTSTSTTTSTARHYYYYSQFIKNNNNNNTSSDERVNIMNEEEQTTKTSIGRIVLAVVVCGDRVTESLVMLKSAMAFTKTHVHFIVMAEKELMRVFETTLSSWPEKILHRLTFDIYPITFPLDVSNALEWRKMFKPCASQRLFLPSLLRDIDSLIYVDTDVLFLRPLEELWHFFSLMNASQLAAMTPEHEDHATGWYNRFARHPYYQPLGVNSGVMLMNLTKMRFFHWDQRVIPIYDNYKTKITWGDQDIINILFHFHPEKLYVYPCEWNFRSDHCMYASVCKSAEQNGVGVLHGSRSIFHNDKQISFKAVYDVFEKFDFQEDLKTHLFLPLESSLQRTMLTNCGKIGRLFLKSLSQHLQKNPL